MAKAYAEWLVRWRWLVLIASVLLSLLVASGAQFIEFKTDYRVFFSEDNPQLQAFDEIQNTYTKTDNVLFVLAPKNGDIFTQKTLAIVTGLTEKSWQIPYSLRVDSITNYQHTEAYGDDLIVEDLVPDTGSLALADLERIRRIALNEPLLVHRIVSETGHVTGVNVTIQLPDPDVQTGKEVPEVTAFARQLVEEIREANPELDVYLTGMVIMNNSFQEVSINDMMTLIPIMFAVVLVTLGILLRSVTAIAGTFLVIAFAIAAAMGLSGWLGIALTPPSASSPTIILTLAVADCVHVLVTVLHNMRLGKNKTAAIVESLRVNMQPIFLTTITTIIGFMSMNFSDAPPFRDLGNIVAMGVAAAFLLSVTLLPALMLVLPVRVKQEKTRHAVFMDRFADMVVEQRKPLFWGMGALVLVLASFLPRNELNDEFVKYFDETVDFRTATDFVSENLTGIYTIDYSLGSGESDGINEPEYLKNVERLADWYREQPGVLHVNTLTDIMTRLNKNMHGDDESWYRLPEGRELAAQYLLLYEMSLPYGLDLNNQIDVSKSATRMGITLESISSNELLEIEARAQQWMKENTPLIRASGASPSIMFAYIGQRNIISMITGTTIALVIISFVLIFALRSVKIGLISLLPNLVPAAMAFGLWGLLVGQVGLGLSIVMGMTLGIVVDDTVHFLSKYLRARREQGMNSAESVRYAFSTVGTALFVTSFVLVAGFMVLAQSGFKINSDMGLLTAVTITFALAADFLLLPPLLMKFDQGEAVKNEVLAT